MTDATWQSGLPGEGVEREHVLLRAHRLLRGRYRVALGLAAGCGIAGAAGGYVAQEPLYQSSGQIRIRPVLGKLLYDTEQSEIMPRFNSYVSGQANYLRTDRVISRAMQSDAWRRVGHGFTPGAQREFERALTVSVDNRSGEWITVSFLDPSPASARTAVEEVIRAYEDLAGETEVLSSPRRIAALEERRRTLDAAVQRTRALIQDITQAYGTTDLSQRYESRLALKRQLEERRQQLEMIAAQGEAPDEPAPAAGPDLGFEQMVAAIAGVDARMRELLASRLRWRGEQERLRSAGMGEEHRDARRVRAELSAIDTQISQHAQDVLAGNPALGQLGSGSVGDRLSPAQVRAQLGAVSAQLDRVSAETLDLFRKMSRVEELSASLAADRGELDRVTARLTQLEFESRLEDIGVAGRIDIVSYGSTPSAPAIDRRLKLAAACGIAGMALPLGILMGLGVIDGRWRYSDEAAGRDFPPLLGVLPRLPEDLGDPEQAAIAAHCVHHVRTLLQIAPAGDERRVLAVTSPTAGDGKTSLALGLGLSFASAGSRTLLVDLDLVGRGLTAGLGAKTEEGVMHAVRAGRAGGWVRATPVEGLSLLPAGGHDDADIPELSLAGVRAVLEEAKRDFDVVIVDTGPILGSIEAALVCAAADGVILAASQGGQRAMAQRALERIESVGGRAAGMVFNRAERGDFRRATSSASIRSVAAGPRPHAPAGVARELASLGPVPRTVAQRLRRSA